MAFRYACLLLTVALSAVPALSYSVGAPLEACADMVPHHHAEPQKSIAPYKIMLDKVQASSGESVTVTVQGNTPQDTIKGLLCQARVGETPVGTFDIPASNEYVQTLDCSNIKKSAVTHKRIATAPNSVSFNWIAPDGLDENVKMTCTIVQSGRVFWVKEQADDLKVN
nr:putative defense protein 1 [Aedes albopictus]